MCHLLDYFIRNRRDISACKCTLCYMHGVSYACRDDLCLDIMESEDLCNSVDEIDTWLGDIIETGRQINGRVSAPLIETIFKTGTALHDGAMIIDGDTILAASCFLPLTSRQDLPQELGTRHRAGIGLSEISDAVVFIVSEETGQISAVVEGRLIRNLSAGGIRRLLFGGDENKDGTERNRIFAKMKNRRKKSQ